MKRKPTNIDDYLRELADDQRAALQRIRKAIHAAAPDAVECISYGMPAFILAGKAVAGFRAAATHCAYHPMSGSVVAVLKRELKAYETSKGTIRFPANKPLPAALVRKLVKARMAEFAKKSQ